MGCEQMSRLGENQDAVWFIGPLYLHGGSAVRYPLDKAELSNEAKLLEGGRWFRVELPGEGLALSGISWCVRSRTRRCLQTVGRFCFLLSQQSGLLRDPRHLLLLMEHSTTLKSFQARVLI